MISKPTSTTTGTKKPERSTSPMREMLRRIERGEDILNLAGGEAGFAPPAELIELASRAMIDRRNGYCSTEGIPALRSAIADLAEESWQARLDPGSNILITVGCMEAIDTAATAVVEPGDHVLIPDPGWGVVNSLMTRLGAEIELYPITENGDTLRIEAGEIISRLRAKTALVVVNTPSNPTGAVLSSREFTDLLDATRSNDTVVISDESYHSYVYDGTHASALAVGGLDNLIVVNSFSKTFAIAGWRLGFAVSNPETIRKMAAIKETISLCSPTATQWAVAEFLPVSGDYRAKALEICRASMAQVFGRLSSIPGIRCPRPTAGYFAFPDLSSIDPSSNSMTMSLMDGGLAVIPGSFFGPTGEGRVRICFADHFEKLAPAFARLEDLLRS